MKTAGFTLAEVLITLSIIGVVAALTIPGLVIKNQEKETVVRLKKVYNVLSNAFSLAVIDYGEPNSWGWGESSGSVKALDKIAPSLNILKRCDLAKGCWPKNVMYKRFDGANWTIIDSDNTYRAKAQLADGMSMAIISSGTNCTTATNFGYWCGDIDIDINGSKGPNVLGKDMFGFRVSSEGVFPAGSPKTGDIENNCRGGSGYACTGWVILKENMDYPASGTNWDTETKNP